MRVGDDKQGFEIAQHLVGAPFLGQFYRRAPQVAGILFQLGFKTAEEREGVRRRSGKSGKNLVLVKTAYLLCRVLDDRLAKGDLAVCGHNHTSIAAYTHNGRGPDTPTGGGVQFQRGNATGNGGRRQLLIRHARTSVYRTEVLAFASADLRRSIKYSPVLPRNRQ